MQFALANVLRTPGGQISFPRNLGNMSGSMCVKAWIIQKQTRVILKKQGSSCSLQLIILLAEMLLSKDGAEHRRQQQAQSGGYHL
jgi:hypothetical protein